MGMPFSGLRPGSGSLTSVPSRRGVPVAGYSSSPFAGNPETAQSSGPASTWGLRTFRLLQTEPPSLRVCPGSGQLDRLGEEGTRARFCLIGSIKNFRSWKLSWKKGFLESHASQKRDPVLWYAVWTTSNWPRWRRQVCCPAVDGFFVLGKKPGSCFERIYMGYKGRGGVGTVLG